MFSNNRFSPFNFNMPIYNWFYPLSYSEQTVNQDYIESVLNQDTGRVQNRSLYFHIAFCQDICAFCPFTREVLKDEALLDESVEALIKEIEMKSKYSYVKDYPISAIFFGGGTPSILKPEHIRKIGRAIRNNFNISEIKEFSFEMNAKTVLEDKVEALKDIGVTHARMGVQTFNPLYRELFKLSATIENIYDGAKLLNNYFDNVCIDMLYGMHGEGIGDIVRDINTAIQLGTSHMDVYPINNGVIQSRLRKSYETYGLKPLTGLDKYIANKMCNELLEKNGYMPHNGHGYYKAENKRNGDRFVDQGYTFQYHESVYGYSGHEILGFGVAAFSSYNECVMGNTSDIKKYVDTINEGSLPIVGLGFYERKLTDIKGLVLHLPYHGIAEKDKIDFTTVDNELFDKIKKLKELEMVNEDENSIWLTKDGWCNYVNLLYYLSPQCEQEALYKYIEKAGIMSEFHADMLF